MTPDHSSRLHLTWVRVRDSLWFAPSLAVLTATILALIAVQAPAPATENSVARTWLFSGGAEGARGVLSAIAGSLITVTGVVFSVTIVALQLASSQFTPRVLGSFVADRVNQVVLSIFIGTFTYTLLVLRTIRSPAEDRTALVPHVAVAIAVVLLLVSVGALIVYINHAARSIQASVILNREAERTLLRVREIFTPEAADTGHRDRVASPDPAPAVIAAAKAGYLQAISAETLWSISRVSGTLAPVTITMQVAVGAFAFPGKALATVSPASAVNDEVTRVLHRALIIGDERTMEQDVEFGLIVISDIAMRALSPGINDPTTARHAIDRATQVLAAIATSPPAVTQRVSPDGTVLLVLRSLSFERALEVAFGQILHFGSSIPPIAKHVLDALADLVEVAPPAQYAALGHQTEHALRKARRLIDDPRYLRAIEEVGAQILERCASVASVPISPAPAPHATV